MRTGALGHSRIGAVVLSAIKMLVANIDKGALVTIDPRKTRVTLLPYTVLRKRRFKVIFR